MVVCLPVFIIACDSNDNSINTVKATVEFEEEIVAVKETVTFLTIPIVASSDEKRDGDIIVNVTVKEHSAGFEKDKDFIITTETLRITPDMKSVNFETGLHVENEEVEKNRRITFHITTADGASLGTKSTCMLDIKEKNFVEGIYTIRGVNAFDDMNSTGKCSFRGEDETLNNMFIDFNLGGAAEVKFTEIRENWEYDVEIQPFRYIGSFDGMGVYLSWAKLDGKQVLYDRNKPIKGKFERKTVEGVEQMVFTFKDGFGLIGANDKGELSWFYNVWKENATMTKNK